MIGSPSDATNGQYDGLGRWIACAAARGRAVGPSRRRHAAPARRSCPPRTSGARTRRASARSGSRRSCTRAAATPSSTRACARPTGRSSRADGAAPVVSITLTMNTRIDTAMMNAPSVADLVPEREARATPDTCTRAGSCPAGPRMCIGPNVRLNPMIMSQKCTLAQRLVEHPCRTPSATSSTPPENSRRSRRRTARSGSARRRSRCRSAGSRPARSACVTPDSPPIDEHRDAADREQHRRREPESPPPHRAPSS